MRALPILLVLLFCACGAQPTPSTPSTPATPLAIDGPSAIDDGLCVAGHCDTFDVARPFDIRPVEDGLVLDFAADVSPVDARHVIMHCRTTGGEGPAAGAVCPIDLGLVKIDVQEGPAGTTLMLHVGDGAQRNALASWYQEHFR